jgi:hypothetical protein
MNSVQGNLIVLLSLLQVTHSLVMALMSTQRR